MPFHPLLKRQIKKFLDDSDRQNPAIAALLVAVNEAYEEADADRVMLERSLDLSSREVLQANSEMRAIFQAFPDLFFRLDHSGRILDCKGGGPGEFLISRERLVGKRIQDVPVDAARQVLTQAIDRVSRSRTAVVVEYSLNLRGHDKHYELRLLPVLEDQLIAIVRDMTERRRFAEALEGQRLFLRQIIDQNPNFIFAKDQAGRFRLVNQAVAEAYGTTVAGLLGKTDADFHDNPEEVEAFQKDDREVLETQAEIAIPEARVVDARGNVRWPQTIKRPILSPDGKELMVLGVAMDITARKLAVESLRSRTEQILRHQDALHELALTADGELDAVLRNILRVSARALNVGRASVWLFNRDRTEINEECLYPEGGIGRGEPAALSLVDGPRYFECLYECRTLAVNDAITDRRTDELAIAYLVPRRIASKLDATIRLHGNIVGVVCHEQIDEMRKWTIEEEHFAASLADLISLALASDERRNLENQLRQSQKMEAVGVLAGGVAHDFSNLLTVMLVYTDLMLARIRQDPTAVAFLAEIQSAAIRAEALTRHLLAFSRKQVLNPKVLDLNSVVRSMENMLRPMIGEDIELVTGLGAGLAYIKADLGQIEQVLMNLVVNARDAMPSGGRLRVSTANLGPERASRFKATEAQETHFVVLTVSDTGIGMDEATLSRIFEPFFTTKRDGKGSGLGLSTVYGIVDQSGGQIEVDSRINGGTSFRIYFPAVHEAIDEVETQVNIEMVPALNRETILLVEDEDSLRQAAVHALKEQGYKVYDVRNGVEAVRLCKEVAEEFHLLITDVVMPQMDGRELASHVTRVRPSTKILYVSGYAKGAILDKGSLEPNSEFLAKPFRLIELLQKVRQVLGTVGVK